MDFSMHCYSPDIIRAVAADDKQMLMMCSESELLQRSISNKNFIFQNSISVMNQLKQSAPLSVVTLMKNHD